jgi:membrane associated rhomboid family serine protease
MFFFPYSTNAPIYYWPVATVVLIAINVLVFCIEMAAPNEQIVPMALAFGEGLHPLQWLTSGFLHADISHLIGNMVFLWSFGLVVEGKLGWYKMLAVYLGIGIAQAAIVQMLMLGSHGLALGASGAIFGLMAICLVWAPENEINCIFVVIVFFFFRCVYFDVKVLIFVGLYLALQLGLTILGNMAMSSEVLHLLGAAVGFPVGVALLKLGLVDCEHWDLFSVWTGQNKMSPEERDAAEALASLPQREKEKRQQRESALEQIREIIGKGQATLAIQAHRRMSREFSDWTLPQPELWMLIRTMHEQKLWTESVPLMVEYLSQYSQKAAQVRLKLAQILVTEEKRPAQSLHVLAKINPADLNSCQQELLKKLQAKANQLHEEDPYEVADRNW